MAPDRHSAPLGHEPTGWAAAAVRTEPVLAAVLAVLVVVLDRLTDRPWQAMTLDLCACAAAAATSRWPRAAGTVLGAILLSYALLPALLLPARWATLGEYALLIPILGAGMRGNRIARRVMSVAYLVILYAVSLANTPAGESAVPSWIVWTTVVAVLWLIGNTVFAMTEAQRKARRADLLLQRQALARQLHDTVARSFAHITLTAERARLREHPVESDWELIADTARRGNDELRLLMALLRDPVETGVRADDRSKPLGEALAAAQDSLSGLGFQVSMVVNGDPHRLSDIELGVLTSAIGEGCANIVKHAEPESRCGIILDIGEKAAELVLINQPRTSVTSGPQPVSMGLDSLASTLAGVGGELRVDSQPQQWTTRILLPVGALSAPVAVGVG